MAIQDYIILYKQEVEGNNCKLIAVSKTHPSEKVLEAYRAGQRAFGENKVQEMVSKWEALPKDIEWHLIGHLQTNKVKYIAPFVSLIHSVDSKKLLTEINKQGEKVNRKIDCLLQVHIAKEETKFGFDEQELMSFIESREIEKLRFVSVKGLMGMATLTADSQQIKSEFILLKELFDTINRLGITEEKLTELSMGMSSDYKIAMEAGSTMVRIGSSIFGHRNYSNPTI